MIVMCDGHFFNVKDAESGRTIARFKSLERVLEFIEAQQFLAQLKEAITC